MLPFAVIDRIGLLQTADWTSQNFFAALGCTQLIDFADISTNRPYRYDAFCEPDELSFHIRYVQTWTTVQGNDYCGFAGLKMSTWFAEIAQL